MSQGTSPNETLESVKAEIPQIFQQMYAGYTQLAQGNSIVDGVAALYSAILFQPEESTILLKCHQVIVIRNRNLYVITCTAAAVNFQKEAASFDFAVKSFKWEN